MKNFGNLILFCLLLVAYTSSACTHTIAQGEIECSEYLANGNYKVVLNINDNLREDVFGPDGQLVSSNFIGQTITNTYEVSDNVMMLQDQLGNVISEQPVFNTVLQAYDNVSDVIETSNGFIFGTTNLATPNWTAFIVETDANGTILNETTVASGELFQYTTVLISDIVLLENNKYAMTYTYPTGSEPYGFYKGVYAVFDNNLAILHSEETTTLNYATKTLEPELRKTSCGTYFMTTGNYTSSAAGPQNTISNTVSKYYTFDGTKLVTDKTYTHYVRDYWHQQTTSAIYTRRKSFNYITPTGDQLIANSDYEIFLNANAGETFNEDDNILTLEHYSNGALIWSAELPRAEEIFFEELIFIGDKHYFLADNNGIVTLTDIDCLIDNPTTETCGIEITVTNCQITVDTPINGVDPSYNFDLFVTGNNSDNFIITTFNSVTGPTDLVLSYGETHSIITSAGGNGGSPVTVFVRDAADESCTATVTVPCEEPEAPCTDNDGDGICAEDDCNDNNFNVPNTVGNSCDDGNPTTINDVYQADGCDCQGTTVSNILSMFCPDDLTIQIPNGQTTVALDWDQSQANATSNCPVGVVNLQLVSAIQPGTAVEAGSYIITYSGENGCGLSSTCSFTVTVLPADGSGGGACNVAATSANGAITITGLTSAENTKLFDADFNTAFECNPWNGNVCSDNEVVTGLNSGETYFLSVQSDNCDEWITVTVEGTDGGGNGNEDCTISGNVTNCTYVEVGNNFLGEATYDLYVSGPVGGSFFTPITTNGTVFQQYAYNETHSIFEHGFPITGKYIEDVANPDCNTIIELECTLLSAGCNVAATSANGVITITGLTSAENIKLFDADFNTAFECNPWNGNVCSENEVVTGLNTGETYFLSVQSDDCDEWIPVTVEGIDSGNEECAIEATITNCQIALGASINGDVPSYDFDLFVTGNNTSDNFVITTFDPTGPSVLELSYGETHRIFTSPSDGAYPVTVTVRDAEDESCTATVTVPCQEPVVAGCNVAATSANGAITITGLTSAENTKLFDADFNVAFECNPWNGNVCSNNETVTGLNTGETYFLSVQSDDCDEWIPVTVEGGGNNGCPDIDGDGICDADDCEPNNPSLPNSPGNTCNDFDTNTTNDIIQADGCTCAGTPATTGCNINVTQNNGVLTITGLTGAENTKLFDATASASGIVWSCDPWTNACTGTETVAGLNSGETYFLSVQSDNCNEWIPITIGVASFQAPVVETANVIAINKIFPNPTSNEVFAQLEVIENTTVTMTLSNVVGQTVEQRFIDLETGNNTISIDLANQTDGIYYINFNSGNQFITKKIVKVK